MFIFFSILSFLFQPGPLAVTEIIHPTTNSLLMSSTDGGIEWHDLSMGLPEKVQALTLANIDDRLYLGTVTALYTRSNETGQKWKKDSNAPNGIRTLLKGKNGMYAITLQHELLQFRTGLWMPLHKNIQDPMIYDLLETEDGILVSTAGGIYKTTNQGQVWKHVLTLPTVNNIIEKNGTYLVSTKNGIWRSTDAGEHWSQALTTITHAMKVVPYNRGFMAIVQGQDFGGIQTANQIYVSVDKGVTWHPMTAQDELSTVYEIRQTGLLLMACTRKGIYQSNDQGNSWKLVHEVPSNQNYFYQLVSTDASLFALRIDGC